MQPSRTILTVLLAIAVALLPIMGGMAASAKAVASVPVVTAVDCCHEQSPCDDSQAGDDCTSMSVCAVKCFNFAGMSDGSRLHVFSATAVVTPAFPVAISRAVPPLLRPPRV